MENINKAIFDLGSTIVKGMTDMLKSLLLPSEDYFDKKIEYIETKFGFVIQFVNFVKELMAIVEGSDSIEPPSFTLDLSSINSKFYYGDSVTIDFKWYEPYRSTVNDFLSGFIWLGFLWNTFKELPSIINGGAAAADLASDKIGGKNQ